ncbi:MAG: amidohydrolase family protein, partial [Clostridia bacterium]|nr:amidohydrolase family protein [Clostridia bacterium]
WDGVLIAYADKSEGASGSTVSEYAARQGKDPFDAYFDLLLENRGVAGGVYSTMRDEDMIEIAKSPYCVIGTDGCSPKWTGFGHPRASAAFPHAIDYFVKEKGIFTIEEMIRKMTSLTAERLHIPQKGLIRDGYDADLLILDLDRLKVHASYTHPHRKSEGIDRVIVNGKTVYRDLEFTGVYAGKLIRYKR